MSMDIGTDKSDLKWEMRWWKETPEGGREGGQYRRGDMNHKGPQGCLIKLQRVIILYSWNFKGR